MLYTLKVMLPSITALSKTFLEPHIFPELFQTSSKQNLNFSNFLGNGKTVNLLKHDLQTRLKSCHLQINEEKEGIITNIAERFVKAMLWNISERFPSGVLEVLDAFSIFDLEKVPTDCSSNEFYVYCNSEVEIL